MWGWVIGLIVSIIVGHVATAYFLVLLRRLYERKDNYKQLSTMAKLRANLGIDFYPPIALEKHISGLIVGPAERLFFTLIIAFEISGAAVAMMVWITLKMLTSRVYSEKQAKISEKNLKEEAESILSIFNFEFVSLLGNLSSMLFALIGGLIILLN